LHDRLVYVIKNGCEACFAVLWAEALFHCLTKSKLLFAGPNISHAGLREWSFASGWAFDRRQGWCERKGCE
jgi:hypothetical protein